MDNLEEALKVGNAIRKLLQSWWGGGGCLCRKVKEEKSVKGNNT